MRTLKATLGRIHKTFEKKNSSICLKFGEPGPGLLAFPFLSQANPLLSQEFPGAFKTNVIVESPLKWKENWQRHNFIWHD